MRLDEEEWIMGDFLEACVYFLKGKAYHRTVVSKIFRAAILDGTVVKQACRVCGNPEARHFYRNYLEPLDVDWLCKECKKTSYLGRDRSTDEQHVLNFITQPKRKKKR